MVACTLASYAGGTKTSAEPRAMERGSLVVFRSSHPRQPMGFTFILHEYEWIALYGKAVYRFSPFECALLREKALQDAARRREIPSWHFRQTAKLIGISYPAFKTKGQARSGQSRFLGFIDKKPCFKPSDHPTWFFLWHRIRTEVIVLEKLSQEVPDAEKHVLLHLARCLRAYLPLNLYPYLL